MDLAALHVKVNSFQRMHARESFMDVAHR
jgi:hypothetical protein